MEPSAKRNGLPCGPAGRESACNVGDLGWIPGLGRSPGEGKGYPLQYSALENPMDRGAWLGTARRITESDTTEVTEYEQGDLVCMR